MIWKKARLAEMSSHKMIAFLSPEDRRNKYVIYHTLELQASKHRGVLRYSESRAFTHEELAKLCYTDLDSLEKALLECKKYELIHEEADGTLIFLEEVEIVSNNPSSGAMSDAERSRRYRERKRQKSIEGAIVTAGQDACGATENHAVTPRDAPAVMQLPREEKNRIIKEEDKEIESTPHNPPQGGEADVRAEQDGHTEYPLERIQRAYDEAVLTSGGKVREEHKEAFCRFLYENGKLENTRRIRNLPGYVKTLYPSWIADGGHHADATQITREELAEWVREYNPKVGDGEKVTKEMEDGFWGWLVAAGFKNGKGILMTKWNIGGPITAWVENRRKEAGRQGTRQSVADDLMHMRGLGVKPWNIDFKRNETI